MWLQRHLTTADADTKQILSGIKAGEEILKKNKEDTSPFSASVLEKIWNMGLVQILAAFILLIWIFDNIIRIIS